MSYIATYLFSGKRQRKPTQKALESEIDLSSIVIKNEVPEPLPEVVDEITSKTEPAETSEQGTHFLAGADASSENPETETKIDDPDKELSELQIAEDAPVDDKEKENKKPGVKVNIFFCFNLRVRRRCTVLLCTSRTFEIPCLFEL